MKWLLLLLLAGCATDIGRQATLLYEYRAELIEQNEDK